MVNKKREMLENWVYGLFGFEERTFIVIRRLIKDLLDNGFTGFKSEYIDYPNGETYRLDLQIRKIENNEPIELSEDRQLLKLYDKLGRYPCKCKMEDIK